MPIVLAHTSDRPSIGAKRKGAPRRARRGPVYNPTLAPIPLCGIKKRPATFSHPDYTVGPGVAPDPEDFRRACLPWDDSFSGPFRPAPSDLPSRALPPIGNWEVPFPHPAPKVVLFSSLKYIAREAAGSQAAWWAGRLSVC